jgi:hypothetical protein
MAKDKMRTNHVPGQESSEKNAEKISMVSVAVFLAWV